MPCRPPAPWFSTAPRSGLHIAMQNARDRGCCCFRGCRTIDRGKWHGIGMGRWLTNRQTHFLVVPKRTWLCAWSTANGNGLPTQRTEDRRLQQRQPQFYQQTKKPTRLRQTAWHDYQWGYIVHQYQFKRRRQHPREREREHQPSRRHGKWYE